MAKQPLSDIKVIVKSVHDVTPDEYRQCMRQGYRQGSIRDALRYERNVVDSKAQVVFAKQSNKILSWSLLQTLPGTYAAKWSAMFWTRLRYRGHGLGSLVARQVKDFTKGSCGVWYHDQPEFFTKTGLTTSVYARSIL